MLERATQATPPRCRGSGHRGTGATPRPRKRWPRFLGGNPLGCCAGVGVLGLLGLLLLPPSLGQDSPTPPEAGQAATEAIADPNPGPPTLQLGDTGPLVRQLQYYLQQQGYYAGSIQGEFDGPTQAAVVRLQEDWGLDPSGVVTAETWPVLIPQPATAIDSAAPDTTTSPANTADPATSAVSPAPETAPEPDPAQATAAPPADGTAPPSDNTAQGTASASTSAATPLWRNPLVVLLACFMVLGSLGVTGAILWFRQQAQRSAAAPIDPTDPTDPTDPINGPPPLPIAQFGDLAPPPTQAGPRSQARTARPNPAPQGRSGPRSEEPRRSEPRRSPRTAPPQTQPSPNPGPVPPPAIPPQAYPAAAPQQSTQSVQLPPLHPRPTPPPPSQPPPAPTALPPRLSAAKTDRNPASFNPELAAVQPNLPKFDIIEALILDLQSANGEKRRRAIWELGQRADSRAVRPLVELMGQSDSQQRSLISAALAELGVSLLKPMQKALVISLQDPNPTVRKNAMRDLMRVYDVVVQTSQALPYVLADPDPEVRETAQWAMAQLEKLRSIAQSTPPL